MLEEENNDLKKILDTLAETEKLWGRHTLASFCPWRNDDIVEQNKYLDALARLFVERVGIKKESKGKQKEQESKEEKKADVCIAVCYDKDRELLLVASNQEQPQGAEFWLQHLKKFTEEPNNQEESCKYLFELAVRNTYFFYEEKSIQRGKKKTAPEPLEEEIITNKFRKKIISYWKKVENEVNFDKEKERKEILTEAKKVSDKMKEEGLTNSPEWEYLVPLDDVNIITKALRERNLNPKLLQNYHFILGKEDVHAEIKIANDIYEFNKGQGKLNCLSILKNFCLLRPRKEYYIGISKLTCGPCQATLNLLNKRLGWVLQFGFRGSHGATYGSNWKIPENIGNEFYQVIVSEIKSKLLPNKLREITSEINYKGLKESDYGEGIMQAQIEQSTMPGTSGNY